MSGSTGSIDPVHAETKAWKTIRRLHCTLQAILNREHKTDCSCQGSYRQKEP